MLVKVLRGFSRKVIMANQVPSILDVLWEGSLTRSNALDYIAWRPTVALSESLTDEARSGVGVSAIFANQVDPPGAASLSPALALPASSSAAFRLAIAVQARSRTACNHTPPVGTFDAGDAIAARLSSMFRGWFCRFAGVIAEEGERTGKKRGRHRLDENT